MAARHEARKTAIRDETRLAWMTGNFVGLAFGGKLKDLKHYLQDESEDASRGGAALLGALIAMKKRGVPMQIERLRKAG